MGDYNVVASISHDRENIAAEFEKFCKEISTHLSIEQMRKILEANGRGWTGSDDVVVPRCMDMVYYGPLDQCPICGGNLECGHTKYYCTGAYSECGTDIKIVGLISKQ